MSIISKVVLVLLLGFLIWRLMTQIRQNPEMLARDKLIKSSYTMGGLALVLIAFIGFCVMWLRHQ